MRFSTFVVSAAVRRRENANPKVLCIFCGTSSSVSIRRRRRSRSPSCKRLRRAPSGSVAHAGWQQAGRELWQTSRRPWRRLRILLRPTMSHSGSALACPLPGPCRTGNGGYVHGLRAKLPALMGVWRTAQHCAADMYQCATGKARAFDTSHEVR